MEFEGDQDGEGPARDVADEAPAERQAEPHETYSPPPPDERGLEPASFEPPPAPAPAPAPVAAAPEPAPVAETATPRRRSTVRERAPVALSSDGDAAPPPPAPAQPVETPQPVVTESADGDAAGQPRRSGWWRRR